MGNERINRPKESMRESDFALMLLVAAVALCVGLLIGEAAGRTQAAANITQEVPHDR